MYIILIKSQTEKENEKKVDKRKDMRVFKEGRERER